MSRVIIDLSWVNDLKEENEALRAQLQAEQGRVRELENDLAYYATMSGKATSNKYFIPAHRIARSLELLGGIDTVVRQTLAQADAEPVNQRLTESAADRRRFGTD